MVSNGVEDFGDGRFVGYVAFDGVNVVGRSAAVGGFEDTVVARGFERRVEESESCTVGAECLGY